MTDYSTIYHSIPRTERMGFIINELFPMLTIKAIEVIGRETNPTSYDPLMPIIKKAAQQMYWQRLLDYQSSDD